MAVFVYPYHRASQSAKSIAQALGGKRIRRENSEYVGKPEDTVINWGCRKLPAEPRAAGTVINHSVFVEPCSHKGKFFDLMMKEGNEDIIPPYTRDRALAQFWLQDGRAYSNTVVCRTLLRSHSGKGIVIANSLEQMVDAKLYTQYIPKKQEYRVYVCGKPKQGFVIDVARKARRLDCEDPNWQVRSWHNGFVFARKDCDPPKAVMDAAIRCHNATCLHFSAVDVVYNDAQQRAFVLEINTAPGIEGQTIGVYADALRKLID